MSRQYAEISMLSVQLCLPVRGHLGVCVCACMCASSCQISHTECETLTLGFLLTLPLACISCTCSSAPSLSPDMFSEARHSPCPMMWHSTALCGGQKWLWVWMCVWWHFCIFVIVFISATYFKAFSRVPYHSIMVFPGQMRSAHAGFDLQ